MELFTGTSGFSYKEWVGDFYPEKTKPEEMLAKYADKLGAVEINNTFYRLPTKALLTRWRDETPERFLFSIKASRKITHRKMLKEAEDETGFLVESLKVLGNRLGAVLFQFPPWFKKNEERLKEFLEILPSDLPAVFEFRDPAWYDEETAALLGERNFSFCFSDMDEQEHPRLFGTADWGYLRLRRQEYSKKDLADWYAEIEKCRWKRALVFFKHEGESVGPRLAMEFAALHHDRVSKKAS